MIEIYLKTNEVKKLNLISEIKYKAKDIFNIRIIDSTEKVLAEISAERHIQAFFTTSHNR